MQSIYQNYKLEMQTFVNSKNILLCPLYKNQSYDNVNIRVSCLNSNLTETSTRPTFAAKKRKTQELYFSTTCSYPSPIDYESISPPNKNTIIHISASTIFFAFSIYPSYQFHVVLVVLWSIGDNISLQILITE